jgi:uncharacterized CHY-type Zn-finger protein
LKLPLVRPYEGRRTLNPDSRSVPAGDPDLTGDSADSIGDVAALPIRHAGHQACEACHGDVLEVKSKGKHAGVNCEACHGPLAKHAEDPSIVPVKPDPAVLCAQCHEASAAKPKWFPQVVTAEHSNGLPCNTCHAPHDPLNAPDAAKTGEKK